MSLTVKEVADELNIHRKTLLRYVNNKEFEGAYKIGNRWRIPKKSLYEFIENLQLQDKKKDGVKIRNQNIISPSIDYAERVRKGEY